MENNNPVVVSPAQGSMPTNINAPMPGMTSPAAAEKDDAKGLCKKHMHRYVCVWTRDGGIHDGIVEHVDDENLYLAVPVGGENANMPYESTNMAPGMHGGCGCGCGGGMRAFGYPGFGFGGYPYGYGRRRFQQLVLPLYVLTAISLLPYY